jgi:prophage regulatory protein
VKTILRRVLRKPEVLAASGYRPTQLDLLIEQGKFPRPIRLSEGGRALGWYEDEIIAFQQARIAERDREAKSKRT